MFQSNRCSLHRYEVSETLWPLEEYDAFWIITPFEETELFKIIAANPVSIGMIDAADA